MLERFADLMMPQASLAVRLDAGVSMHFFVHQLIKLFALPCMLASQPRS